MADRGRKAVVLAGGRGTRLGPYTTILPKPLMPIGDRSILEIMVDQLRMHEFNDLVFAVGYLAHLLKAVFGDGSQFGVNITYHTEEMPLGTAGALRAIDGLEETFLFMNGDVLTTIDYDELFETHRRNGDLLTIASYPRTVPVDFGVLKLEGDGISRRLLSYEEKPVLDYFVSMGIYAAEPGIRKYIKPNEQLDLPTLVDRLIAAGESVGAYVHEGYWLDIGRPEDYEQAVADPAARALIAESDENLDDAMMEAAHRANATKAPTP